MHFKTVSVLFKVIFRVNTHIAYVSNTFSFILKIHKESGVLLKVQDRFHLDGFMFVL